MTRPITTLTGPRADLPFEEAARFACDRSSEGLEIASWGDLLAPEQRGDRRLRREPTRDP